MIGIMGVAFAFSMYLESQATRQFVATTQARYVAEAGVNHARVLLDEDRLGSRADDTTEAWTQSLAGGDVDVDGDGTREAKWWSVVDERAQTVGRYAIRIVDEGGKADLNAAQGNPSEHALPGVDLVKLLEAAKVSEPERIARAVETYRYGADGKPGRAGIDDDADGSIDEPDEYQPLALQGDDRRIEGLEELVAIAGISAEELAALSRLMTVYSWDANVSVTGDVRVNVNTATADELLTVLLSAGVEDPWQAAVNMADYTDSDVAMSRVSKSSHVLWISDQGPLGGWAWKGESGGHYRSDGPGAEALSWSVSVPTGKFRVRALGISGMKIGDVTLAGQFQASVDHGQLLGVFDLSGTLQIAVNNREAVGTPCAFRGLELVSESPEGGAVVRGVEAVRFNELMVDPVASFDISTVQSGPAPTSQWTCDTTSCIIGADKQGKATWTWVDASVPAGSYYVRVFGTQAGQIVGEVRIGGTTQTLVHGQRHPSTLTVGESGIISVTLDKTTSGNPYYFKRLELSVQPDGEYIELINLSDRDLDVGGWTIDGTLAGGRQARLPAGSVIRAHGLLVAAVDLDDTQDQLASNGIDSRTAWSMASGVNAVQLEFPGGGPTPDDDWLKIAVPAGSSPRLALSRLGTTVDEIEYPLPPTATAKFQSLEKGDPGVVTDADGDGADEGWFPSLSLFTPGQTNDNEGLKETVGLETVTHDPGKEITILNRPLGGVGELAGVPSGTPWKPFASADLAKIVDRLTVEGHRLEAEGHAVGGESAGAWEEKSEGYFLHTDPAKADVSGAWEWTAIPDGDYRMSLYGREGEQLAVRWQRQDTSFSDWSPPLSTDAQGRIVIGQVTIGGSGTRPNTLRVEVRCASPSGVCHFDHVRLDPQLVRVGVINVNTAPLDVLLALPGMTDTQASRIVAGRPYGDRDQKGRGIGDLLVGDVLGTEEEDRLAAFRRMAHVLTTRSAVFQILSLGQKSDGERVGASQRIQTIVQR